MSRETKNVIELKCDPAKLKRLNELFPNDRPTPIEHDACVAHALMKAIEEMRKSGMPRIQSVYQICADIEATADEILESEFGISHD